MLRLKSPLSRLGTPTRLRSAAGHALAVAPALAGFASWAASVARADVRAMTDLGLVSVLPPAAYVGLALLAVGFALALARREQPRWLLPAHVVLLVLALHGVPTLVYGTLRYSWTWKHLGIVDYIARHGSVDRDIGNLAAYHNWPGFFSLNTLVAWVAGLDSPRAYAPWAPLFFNLASVIVLPQVFRPLTRDRRRTWLAVWLVTATSWVGQDYFSPQAVCFLFYQVLLAVCLRWLDPTERRTRPPKGSRLRRLIRSWYERATRAENGALASQAPATPAQRVGLVASALFIVFVTVTTHQLTPYMMVAALAALAIFRRLSVRSLPLIAVAATAAWVVFFAEPFLRANAASIAATIGQFLDNLGSNISNTAVASSGHRIVSLGARGLTGSVWLLALAGGVRAAHRGEIDVRAVLLALSPFVMLAGNSYGGEILFRCYLFSLPFMAFLASGLLRPAREEAPGPGWMHAPAVAALSIALLAAFLLAHFGNDRFYVFSTEEIQAAEYVYDRTRPGTLLVEGTRNYPAQFRNYEEVVNVAIDREPPTSRDNLLAHPAETLSRWMRDPRWSQSFLILTKSMKAETEAIGTLPVGSLDAIESALAASPMFSVAFSNRDATVFVPSTGQEVRP